MGFDDHNENQNAEKNLNGNVFIIQQNNGSGFLVFDPIANDAIVIMSNKNQPLLLIDVNAKSENSSL